MSGQTDTPASGPPVNLEAEESLLGGLLTSNAVLPAVLAEQDLSAEAFYLDSHRTIYEAIRAMHDRGEPSDVVTVVAELERRGRLEAAGGKDAVMVLAAKVAAPGSAPAYARVVVANAQMRRLDAAAKMIQSSVAQRDGEPTEIAAKARELLDESTPSARTRLEGEQLEDLAYTLAEGDPRPVFPWPLHRLNVMAGQGNANVGGIRPGQLCVISGHTHFGKTALIHQCLDSFAKAGAKCALYHNEMGAEDHVAGILQRHAGVPAPELLSGRLSDQSRRAVAAALNNGTLRRWPVVPIHGRSAREVCSEIRLQREDVVAVDILHNFVLDDNRNAERELSDTVSLFYETARVSGTAILLASHVNRNRIVTGVRPRPTRGDLRGTGDIENKADIILFVHREQDTTSYEPLADGDGNAVYFDKFRGGWLGGYWGPEHPIRFNERRLRFDPVQVESTGPTPLDITASQHEREAA